MNIYLLQFMNVYNTTKGKREELVSHYNCFESGVVQALNEENAKKLFLQDMEKNCIPKHNYLKIELIGSNNSLEEKEILICFNEG